MTAVTTEQSPKARAGLDVEAVRRQFPALDQSVHGKPLVYLDSAATALKPEVVIDAVRNVYARDCANIHRAVHLLSQRATQSFEGVREKVRALLNAPSAKEVVFVRGTTEAVNMVAQAWARPRLGPGDRILLSTLEHHSNIVPWQVVAQQTGAELVVVPVTDAGEVRLEDVEARLDERVKLVAMSHVSNALGSVQPVEAIVERAHAVGAKVLLDGATSTPSAGTSSTGRPAPACSGGARRSSRRWTPTRAAAT
jgi:cysteine desulfurase/selenocysteine lyase